MNLPQGHTPAALGYFISREENLSNDKRPLLDQLCQHAACYLSRPPVLYAVRCCGRGDEVTERQHRRKYAKELTDYLTTKAKEDRQQAIIAGTATAGVWASILFSILLKTLVRLVVSHLVRLMFSEEGNTYVYEYGAAYNPDR